MDPHSSIIERIDSPQLTLAHSHPLAFPHNQQLGCETWFDTVFLLIFAALGEFDFQDGHYLFNFMLILYILLATILLLRFVNVAT